MTRDTREELLELYTELTDCGVVFHYGNEEIDNGEITNFEIDDEDVITIELDGCETYEIELQDFIENHSKDGVNYHSFEMGRRFDHILADK